MKPALLIFFICLSFGACKERKTPVERTIETVDTPMADFEEQVAVSSLDSQRLVRLVKILLKSLKNKNIADAKLFTSDIIYCSICKTVDSANVSQGGDTDYPVPIERLLSKYADSLPALNYFFDSLKNCKIEVSSVMRRRSETNIMGNNQIVYNVCLVAKDNLATFYDFIKENSKFKLIGFSITRKTIR